LSLFNTHHLAVCITCPPLLRTVFPYTTLFRSIDAIADALSRGGRLIYIGAGTSGRIAALDAAECPPTFSTDPKQVQFVIAGGERDRKSTRLNSSHLGISYAVFCLKKKT